MNEINKISKDIAKIFEQQKWKWCCRKEKKIPNWLDIKKHILNIIKQKPKQCISCGRIRIENDEYTWNILLEFGDIEK